MRTMQMKWKLLMAYLVVVAVCVGVVIAVTRQLSISSFSDHLRLMRSMGHMMTSMTADLDDAFREALNISLFWGGLAAVIVAVALSFFIASRITNPIHRMAEVTEMIAEGDYSQRVEEKPGDEIGNLAHSLNRMAERLDESQRLRQELMANIAHELRTPLSTISGYMEGLADGVVPPTTETYHLIQSEAGRLSRLVDDLQRLSRAESGEEILDIVSLPLDAFMERIQRKFEHQYNQKQVALDLTLEGDIAIRADEDKMEQVISNLLDNALRYTSAGGGVEVSGVRAGDSVEIQIRDSGSGISSDDLPYVFERFYRADKSRSRESGGSGIGLTIAKRYLESLNGTIQVESNEGKGTIFSIRIPPA